MIYIDSDKKGDNLDSGQLRIKEEIKEMFDFSDEELAEEEIFEREHLPESPTREQTSQHQQPESSGIASTSQTVEPEPEPSERVVRWEHNIIRTAFLEDSAKKIFVRRIKELDPAKV